MGSGGSARVVDFCRDKRIFLNEDREDRMCWRNRDGKLSDFKASNVWKEFRNDYPKVSWAELVWFSNAIPKHSFILWLAIRDRLTTQDMMHFWDIIVDARCPFCSDQLDSVKHLFFECHFSVQMCEFFRQKEVNLPRNVAWPDLVDFAAEHWKGKSKVELKSPASDAGICIDDIIIQIDGKRVGSSLEFTSVLLDKSKEPKEVIVKRAGSIAPLKLTVLPQNSGNLNRWPVPEERSTHLPY